MKKIPVTVIVVTKNEAARIGRCLAALQDFAELLVVDSGSTDDTAALSKNAGAQLIDFSWNGQYPKKRQWCLDTLPLKHEWVFFVDADEIISAELVREIAVLFDSGDPACAGYFIKGRYMIGDKMLRFGLHNNKLALLDRGRINFPVIDDLDIEGMGEIEGHYQPVLKGAGAIGCLQSTLRHYAYDEMSGWEERHLRYARWEQGMTQKKAWPVDPVLWRQCLKRLFRALPLRPLVAFAHSYVLKLGFLDGRAGFYFARDRYRYYKMVQSDLSL